MLGKTCLRMAAFGTATGKWLWKVTILNIMGETIRKATVTIQVQRGPGMEFCLRMANNVSRFNWYPNNRMQTFYSPHPTWWPVLILWVSWCGVGSESLLDREGGYEWFCQDDMCWFNFLIRSNTNSSVTVWPFAIRTFWVFSFELGLVSVRYWFHMPLSWVSFCRLGSYDILVSLSRCGFYFVIDSIRVLYQPFS
jgi:hypothetical protein